MAAVSAFCFNSSQHNIALLVNKSSESSMLKCYALGLAASQSSTSLRKYPTRPVDNWIRAGNLPFLSILHIVAGDSPTRMQVLRFDKTSDFCSIVDLRVMM